MSAVSHIRLSAVSHSTHVCCVTQQTWVGGQSVRRLGDVATLADTVALDGDMPRLEGANADATAIRTSEKE